MPSEYLKGYLNIINNQGWAQAPYLKPFAEKGLSLQA